MVCLGLMMMRDDDDDGDDEETVIHIVSGGSFLKINGIRFSVVTRSMTLE
jgi:hypothetical protein